MESVNLTGKGKMGEGSVDTLVFHGKGKEATCRDVQCIVILILTFSI